MKTRVHLNRHVITRNRKTLKDEIPEKELLPPIAIRRGSDRVQYAFSAKIHGPSTLVYSPDKPLRCGAVAWVETDYPVTGD